MKRLLYFLPLLLIIACSEPKQPVDNDYAFGNIKFGITQEEFTSLDTGNVTEIEGHPYSFKAEFSADETGREVLTSIFIESERADEAYFEDVLIERFNTLYRLMESKYGYETKDLGEPENYFINSEKDQVLKIWEPGNMAITLGINKDNDNTYFAYCYIYRLK